MEELKMVEGTFYLKNGNVIKEQVKVENDIEDIEYNQESAIDDLIQYFKDGLDGRSKGTIVFGNTVFSVSEVCAISFNLITE